MQTKNVYNNPVLRDSNHKEVSIEILTLKHEIKTCDKEIRLENMV